MSPTARSRLASMVTALVVTSIALGALGAPTDASGVTTPGYRGTRHAPRTSTPVPKPVKVGGGDVPTVLVDAGGTAHVAWNDLQVHNETPALHYCRLKRGATSCDNPRRDFPQTDGATGAPLEVAYGDSLILLTQRRAVGADPTAGGPVYAYVSDDGGTTFQGAQVGGGAGSDDARLQGAVTFGPAGSEQIGLVFTGGYFQAVRPGVPPGPMVDLIPETDQDALSGSAIAATPGDGMTAAFEVSRSKTVLRTWNRTGNPSDPAQWSPRTTVPGTQPQMGGGPAGTYLQTVPPFSSRGPTLALRKLATGGSPGTAITLSTGQVGSRAAPAVDAHGVVTTAWATNTSSGSALVSRTVTARSHVGARATLVRAKSPAELLVPTVAAIADGGGFAAVRRNVVGGPTDILVAAFGSQEKTDALGLGHQPGGGPNTEQGVVETCSKVSYSALDVVAGGGCLLNAVGHPGTKVSQGLLKLNGLEIVPDEDVKILLNSREKTFDTTGKVTVQLRLDSSIVIPLLHDELHLKLPSESDKTEAAPGCTGTKLMAFDADVSKPLLKGFPIRGQIAVYLGADSACIPVALGLPKAFGDVHGSAVLRLTNKDGLDLQSMAISVKGLYLGPLLIEDLSIKYMKQGNQWDGSAKVGLPPQPGGVKIGGSVQFKDGAFAGATISADPVFPGLPLVGPTFLASVGGGFHLDPFSLEATATVGAIPLAPGVYTVSIRGKLVITFGDPVVFDFTGNGDLLGFGVATAGVTVTSDGFFRVQAAISLNLTVASVSGMISFFVDLPSKTFAGKVKGTVCVFSVCPEAEAIISSKGIGACVDVRLFRGGFGYKWGDDLPELFFPTCDLSEYDPPVPAGAGHARAAQSAARTFSVAARATVASIKVTGNGGLPSVVLISPSGQRIMPSTDLGKRGAPAYAVADAVTKATYVGILKPAAGTWTVEAAPGSPAIADLRQAQPLAPPKVSAKLGGKGHARTLRYTARRSGGLSTTFVETNAHGGSRVIGRATKNAGTIHFATGLGPRGRRTVTAMTARAGIPRLETKVGTYTAPAPLRPSRAGRVRVTRSRHGLLVRWGHAKRAIGYTITARLSDGRTPFFTAGARARKVRIRAVPGDVKAAVTVVGRDRAGRAGPAARGKTPRKRRPKGHH